MKVPAFFKQISSADLNEIWTRVLAFGLGERITALSVVYANIYKQVL